MKNAKWSARFFQLKENRVDHTFWLHLRKNKQKMKIEWTTHSWNKAIWLALSLCHMTMTRKINKLGKPGRPQGNFHALLADLLPFMVNFERTLWRQSGPPAYHHQMVKYSTGLHLQWPQQEAPTSNVNNVYQEASQIAGGNINLIETEPYQDSVEDLDPLKNEEILVEIHRTNLKNDVNNAFKSNL